MYSRAAGTRHQAARQRKDFAAGVTKYGVAHYKGTAALKVKAPEARPALLPPSAQELPALLPPAQELRFCALM